MLKKLKTIISAVLLSLSLPLGASHGHVFAPAQASDERVMVKVGGYPFEPFVEQDGGITPAFLDALNARQSAYHFEFVSIPAQRRYELLRRGVIDAVFFEMPRWGWQPLEAVIDVTHPVLRGAEVYIALNQKSEGSDLFRLSPAKKVALTLGYHYAFADFNADQAYIHSKVDAVFSESMAQTLRYLTSGAVEIALVSDLFLRREFSRKPDLQYQLVQRPLPDQEYELSTILRKDGPITSQALDKVFASMDAKTFFKTYGLDGLVMAH